MKQLRWQLRTLLVGLGALAGGLTTTAGAVEGIYLGGQIGHVDLSGNAGRTFNNAIGFGADLGVRTNPVLDIVFRFQASSHSPSLSLMSQTLSADFHFLEVNDFDFSLGAGPGFYFFKTTSTQSLFGIHGEANADVIVGDGLRVGLGWRYHGIFSPGAGEGDYWSVMMRFGYLFALE